MVGLIFDAMGYTQAPTASFHTKKEHRIEYNGGMVLQPKKGLYHNLVVVDVTSLYPTMAILHNISFDNMNCECCRYDSSCKINDKEITKDCRIEKEYWICRQKEVHFLTN